MIKAFFFCKEKNVFTLCAVKVWTELPGDVVWAPSVNSFK